MAKVIIMMVTRHEYIVGIYFSIIPPWRAEGGRIYTLHNIHVEFPLSWGPFYGLKGAEDQRACEPGGYLPIKRLTIFPTIYVWRPAALTFGRTLSVSQSTWIQKRKIQSRKSIEKLSEKSFKMSLLWPEGSQRAKSLWAVWMFTSKKVDYLWIQKRKIPVGK